MTPTVTRYTRQDVIRILGLDARQLAAWERAGLTTVPPVTSANEPPVYSFEHLRQLRALNELNANPLSNTVSRRISVGRICASVSAMQKVSGMSNVLVEAGAMRHGRRLMFRHAGRLMDPVTQQFAFDFELPQNGLKVVNARQWKSAGSQQRDSAELHAQVQEMFLRGVQCEESGAVAAAIEVYESLLTHRADHAPACINLGTILYNQREFERAEAMYRRATVADANYALAFFDLGNVLDEMLRLEEAIAAYGRAIELVPTYADAHYNLALAYERTGERRRALRHWMAYVRLDAVGPWSTHARGQARKILSLERLSIVTRGGKRTTARR